MKKVGNKSDFFVNKSKIVSIFLCFLLRRKILRLYIIIFLCMDVVPWSAATPLIVQCQLSIVHYQFLIHYADPSTTFRERLIVHCQLSIVN